MDRIPDADLTAPDSQTGIPDLDALLTRYPGALARFALDLPPARHQQFKRYLVLRLPPELESRLSELKQQLEGLNSVSWARDNRAMQTQFYPGDPQFNQQWGAWRLHAQEAWDVTFGSADVPLAIIDTGCQLDHPDLVESIWINENEIPDNGIDDDQNGFIDDVRGWDFVDAPTFPTSGDYLVRDNDPSDEMGHGTAVAGICGATIDNDIGVAGVAPDCPVMVLRAGNAAGYLQEDDVATAILYALDNGARVINMSFGDIQASPMLEDAVEYAYQGGVVLVAASGNNGLPTSNYPAAFGPVLSIGSCTSENSRAWDSNYGSSLDLLAPGVEIISTLLNGEYGLMPPTGSGTSFATPHATATAGLVLSLHPDWGPAEVNSALKAATDDLGVPGWNPESGHGILRADKAVAIEEALTAEIVSPAMGQGYTNTDTLLIMGTAAGIYFKSFRVMAGLGENPTSWEIVNESNKAQIINGLLATWTNDNPLDSVFTIRLTVTDIYNQQIDDRVLIHLDPTPPDIDDIELLPILDGERPSYLLKFTTGDVTTGKVWLKEIGSPDTKWLSQTLGYETNEHTILIGRDLPFKQFEYYIWVENSTGLVDTTDILGTLDLSVHTIETNFFVEDSIRGYAGIPAGEFYEVATDFDNDGYLEVWTDTLDSFGGISNLRVYEATPGWKFDDVGLDFGLEIPKSVGDSDADGKLELMTLYSGNTKIFEAPMVGEFPDPNNIYWSYSSGSVWGSSLLDLNPSDDFGEVLLQESGYYFIYQNRGTGQLQNPLPLPNPLNANPIQQPPYCRVYDFDGDGLVELLFGDLDGNLYIYERQSDGSFENTWSMELPLLDTGEFVTDGDYDNDGQQEFATLAHTSTSLIGEHQADTRYWALYIFENEADNTYAISDTFYFFGAENPADFASGINSGDVYGSEEPEMILCLYPDLYIIDWDADSLRYKTLWYYPECQSNKAVIGDFNLNGHNEFLFNTGSEVKIFEAVGDWSYALPPPLNFTVTGPDIHRVRLTWTPVNGADEYTLLRVNSAFEDTTAFAVEDTLYEDFSAETDSTYYYSIATFKLGLGDGPRSDWVPGTPNEPPEVVGDTAHFTSPNFVTVEFSEPMGSSLVDVSNYWILSGTVQPTSAISDAGGKQVVLSFNTSFSPGDYPLKIHEVYDLQGSKFSNLDDPDTLRFTVPAPEHNAPYLASAAVNAKATAVTLVFSDQMVRDQMANALNFDISVDAVNNFQNPDPIRITDAVPETNNTSITRLYIDPATPIGALGKVYRITASNLHNLAGTPLDPNHNSTSLSVVRRNLKDVFVYPNPYKAGGTVDGEDCVVFANLTRDSEIKILNISGIVVRTIKSDNNPSGGVRWYMDNDKGDKVGSGIYLYQVTGNGDSFWGKLAVVR